MHLDEGQKLHLILVYSRTLLNEAILKSPDPKEYFFDSNIKFVTYMFQNLLN